MEELSLRDIFNILNRQKIYLVSVTGLLFLAVVVVASGWSNYRSTATVEIQQSTISSSVTNIDGQSANDGVMVLADQRISKIEQKVTSLGSLAEIITKYDLYPDVREKTPIDVLAEKARKKINLDFISSTISNPAAAQKQTAEQLSAIAFKLSFDYTDPRVAQQVVDELVTRFLDEDLKMRRAQAKETSDFLAAQITALEASIAEQEKEIATFRSKYGDSGPASLMFNQQAASNNRMAMQNIEAQMTSNQGIQGGLRAQLATVEPYSRVSADGQMLTTPALQLKALESSYAALSGQYGPEHPDVIKARNQIKALKAQTGRSSGNNANIEAQITDLETNLAAAVETKGADHPDVLSMQRRLKTLQNMPRSTGGGSGLKRDADNPAYIQLSSQLNAAEEQYKSLVMQHAKLAEQQAKYEQAVASNPLIEEQMAKLTRDHESAQLRYRELKEKKMTADMNEQLEQDRKGQRLVVINPPNIPTNTQPSRMLLLLGGLVFSLIGGLCAVILVESLNQGVHGASHLSFLVGAAPLVVVPYIAAAETEDTAPSAPHPVLAKILAMFRRTPQ